MASDLIENLRFFLPGIMTPMMRGDNLAIVLCSAFDDRDEEQDENGWSPSALKGYEEVIAAIHSHYADALDRLQADHDAVRREALEAAVRIAERTRDQFLSTQYATNQPLGSFSERFACDTVADAIRSLIPASQPDLANPDGEGQDRG